jgi:hypothetical protein
VLRRGFGGSGGRYSVERGRSEGWWFGGLVTIVDGVDSTK